MDVCSVIQIVSVLCRFMMFYLKALCDYFQVHYENLSLETK